MTLANSCLELPLIEKDMTEQFRQELQVAEFRPISYMGLRDSLEAASSIELQKGPETILAVVAVAENEVDGATFGLPFINPLRSSEQNSSQMSHFSTINALREKIGVTISDYLSLYIWRTIRHTPEVPDMIGICHGSGFNPPYRGIRRVYVETVVRETQFLRLFAADYEYAKLGKKVCTLVEFK